MNNMFAEARVVKDGNDWTDFKKAWIEQPGLTLRKLMIQCHIHGSMKRKQRQRTIKE